MGKQKSKGRKAPGRGREKTERKTAKAEEKRSRREAAKKANDEDDISAILVRRTQPLLALCVIPDALQGGKTGMCVRGRA